MAKIIFIWYLMTGVVVPSEKDNDGEMMYSIILKKENKAIDYAHKKEVIDWIKTDHFEYENYCGDGE